MTTTSASKRKPVEYDRIPKLQYLRIGDPRVGHVCMNAASAIPCRSLRNAEMLSIKEAFITILPDDLAMPVHLN